MAEDPTKTGATPKQEKRHRLAMALRENLSKRKALQRARATDRGEPGLPAAQSTDKPARS